MRKQKRPDHTKKLSIQKETVRLLTHAESQSAAGGTLVPTSTCSFFCTRSIGIDCAPDV
jgi:hypothetical protein